MAHPPRLSLIFESYDAPLWFITACTDRRQPWLASAQVHVALMDFARRGLDESRAAIGRYVLMPDHLHLFVRLAREEALGQWVKALKRTLAKSAPCADAHWQSGFFDHLLRRSESYALKWEYVRMNPVRAGLVSDSEAWPYQGEICRLPFD